MTTGTILKLMETYGFIRPDDSDTNSDCYFTQRELVDIAFGDLSEGEAVQFDVEHDPAQGSMAKNIKRA